MGESVEQARPNLPGIRIREAAELSEQIDPPLLIGVPPRAKELHDLRRGEVGNE